MASPNTIRRPKNDIRYTPPEMAQDIINHFNPTGKQLDNPDVVIYNCTNRPIIVIQDAPALIDAIPALNESNGIIQ